MLLLAREQRAHGNARIEAAAPAEIGGEKCQIRSIRATSAFGGVSV
jgi:hypothetical protein